MHNVQPMSFANKYIGTIHCINLCIIIEITVSPDMANIVNIFERVIPVKMTGKIRKSKFLKS